ncbi:MAG: NAD(P)-dependent alcohol dehydrogenase [Deinococcales bacterium]|jgi:NADPH:quinone reductase-like Zn-dependent oxidoreductase
MSTVVHVEGSQRGARSPASAVPARMTAVVQHVYGTTDTLAVEQVEVPSLEPREVLLRVRAAAVNPADRAILQGLPYVLRLVYGIPRPRTGIRGSDVAGVVEAVGVAVTQFGAGDEVFGWCQGAFAEYAATTETSLAAKPAALSFEQAAAVPMAGITALQALRDQAGLEAGQRVLVNGASGGVGTFAVQVAKAMGAEVTGVCSTRNVELVRTIGADHVIDYTHEDFTRSAGRYDVILDNVGNHTLAECRRALTPTGVLIPNSMAGNRWFGSIGRVLTALVTSPFVRQNLRPFFSIPKKTDLLVLVDLLEAGRITPVIDSTHPLGDAPAAIAHLGGGHARGKIVLTV